MWQNVARCVALLTAVGLAIGAGGAGAAGQGSAGKKSDAVVKVTATADKPGTDGRQVIHVNLAVDPGWHTYANPIGDDVGIPTAVTVEGKTGAQVNYPAGKAVKDAVGNYFVYEGNVTIDATVPRTPGDSPLKVKVKIQACNERSCLQPATVELAVP